MRKFTIAIAALSVLTLATAAQAQIMSGMTTTGASATYDPATGGITFDGFDDGELGIKLISASGVLLANATDLGGAAGGILGVVNQSEVPNFIEWGQLAGFNFASEFAGNVVTANTAASDLSVEVAITPSDIETLTFMATGNDPPVADLADVMISALQLETMPTATVLDASGSSDPNGDTLSFAFDVDGDGIFETDNGNDSTLDIADVRATFGNPSSAMPRVFNVGVEVSDGMASSTDTATVTLAQVPEPGAVALASIGLIGLVSSRRRKAVGLTSHSSKFFRWERDEMNRLASLRG